MDFVAFVARICSDGREAAAQSYAKPRDADKLEGAHQGFLEASLTRSPSDLLDLWTRASKDMTDAFARSDKRYWFYRCRQAEIDWTANVVSAALLNEGKSVIIQPTARGLMKAAEILGVRA